MPQKFRIARLHSDNGDESTGPIGRTFTAPVAATFEEARDATDIVMLTDTILNGILVEGFENDADIEKVLRKFTVRIDKLLLRALGMIMTRWPPPMQPPGSPNFNPTMKQMQELLQRRIEYDTERRKHIQILLEYNNRTLERARKAEAELRELRGRI